MNKKSVRKRRIILAIASFTALAAIPAPAYSLDAASQAEESAINTAENVELAESANPALAQAPDANDDDTDDTNDVELELEDDVELPDSVRAAVLQTISTESDVSVSELRVVGAQQEAWSDGCLGLGGPAESCLAAVVPGWLVTATDGDRFWVYRTNESGAAARFDEAATETLSVNRTETRIERRVTQTTETQRGTVEVEQGAVEVERGSAEVAQGSVEVERRSGAQVVTQETTFSQTVQTAVFQAIAQRSNVQTANLRVVEVRQKTWSDGCLGISGTGSCTQAQVPGWLVVVTNGQQYWVYRTDRAGSVVNFDAVASETRTRQWQLRAQTNPGVSFVDVAGDYWANRFITELAALDVIAGYPDGRYRPEQPVTRAEFAAIVRRAFEVTEVRNAANFVDVDADYWAYSAIQESYKMGFLGTVSSNQFRPLTTLARGEVLLAIARGLRLSTTDVERALSAYSDVTISASESRTLLAAVSEQGIVVNYPNVRQLNLERVATRAEVAAFVYQTLVSLGRVESVSSPYIVPGNTVVIRQDNSSGSATRGTTPRNCNQGIGNGAEGCDPGNSAPHGGSNDEGGRSLGN